MSPFTSQMKENPTMTENIFQKNKIWIKPASRMLCLSVLLAIAIFLGSTGQAQSSQFSCILSSGFGEVTVLSCGSSAGNFIYSCNQSGCEPATGSGNDTIANLSCAQYAQEGCPPTIFGDGGGPGRLMP